MHPDGFVILLVPAANLWTICRGGKWHWKVVNDTLFNGLFWLGWFTALFVGLVRISGVA